MGTNTPVVELHVVNGDSPTLRLEQDGSSGFTPQTWDVAGNETNFFVRDATNGSRLPFKIRPSAPTNSLFVDTDGDVGVGTASPAGGLHVANSGGTEDDFVVTNDGKVGIGTSAPVVNLDVKGSELRLDNRGSAFNGYIRFINDSGSFSVGMSGAASNDLLFYDRGLGQTLAVYRGGPSGSWEWYTNGAQNMTLDSSGNLTTTGTVNGVSDRNAKDDVEEVIPAAILDKVAELPINEWSYKADEENLRHIGPMAQDFRRQFGLGKDDKTIALSDASGVALAAIKGLHQLLEEKDTEIESLREKTDTMETQLKQLMEKLDRLDQ